MNTNSIDPLLIAWRRAWTAPQPPDLLAFLTTHPHAAVAVIAQVCALDLRLRTASGTPRRVEDYLPVHPPLADDEEAVVELAYAEYRAGVELGTPPTLVGYSQRFPTFAPAIIRQIQVDQLFDDEGDATRTCAERPGSTTAVNEVPARLGRYLVLGRLDGGGQADVFRAVHPELRTEVVIKWSRPGSPAADTLRQEGQLLARLDHPHLARIYDLDVAGDRPFVVMESISGQNLRQLRASRPVTPSEAVRWMTAVAQAVEYAHRLGITHRDIKPANILIDAHGHARLIDFGLAQTSWGHADNSFDAGRISGTATFMAPEQAQGLPVGPAADVFALGGVLYFLLTGQPPFAAESLSESLSRAARGEWNRAALAKVPPRLARVCQRALATDPADRYPSAAAFAAALTPTVPVPALIGAGAGVLAGLLLLGWCLWPTRSEPPAPALTPVAPAAVTADLSVAAWVGERYVPLPNPAPLQTGQHVRITAEVPAGYHTALFAFAPDGLTHLADYPAAAEMQTIRYPREGQKASTLGPPAGTQIIVLVGSPAGPIDADRVQKSWSPAAPWPVVPEMSVLHLSAGTVKVVQRSRAIGPAVTQLDPEGAVRAQLRAVGVRLSERFALVEAVAFRQTE
jgi:hypothetical protein